MKNIYPDNIAGTPAHPEVANTREKAVSSTNNIPETMFFISSGTKIKYLF